MTLVSLIHSVGNLGLFPSRAFIPAFLTALLLRVGPHIPAVQSTGLLYGLSGAPTWFTSDFALVALGILSVLEIAATKSSDVREFLHEFDSVLKAAMAFLTTAGVLSVTDRQVINGIETGGTPALTDLGLSAAVAGAVFYISNLRAGVMSTLSHADPHDDLHLQRLISWMEDLWSVFGLLLIVLFPLFMLLVVALITGGLFLLQRYLEHCEEKTRVPCAGCGVAMYATALACPSCKREAQQPRAVGFLGLPSKNVAADRSVQAMDLIAKKRCPVCATRFTERAARQTCSACAHTLMENRATSDAYLAHIDHRLEKTLGICMALSLIPVLGIIPGIIYYRIKLVGPFRQYISFGKGMLVKWSVRLLNLILILFQPVPLLGAFLLPIMAYTNYRVYRGVYCNLLAVPAPATVQGAHTMPAQNLNVAPEQGHS